MQLKTAQSYLKDHWECFKNTNDNQIKSFLRHCVNWVILLNTIKYWKHIEQFDKMYNSHVTEQIQNILL